MTTTQSSGTSSTRTLALIGNACVELARGNLELARAQLDSCLDPLVELPSVELVADVVDLMRLTEERRHRSRPARHLSAIGDAIRRGQMSFREVRGSIDAEQGG